MIYWDLSTDINVNLRLWVNIELNSVHSSFAVLLSLLLLFSISEWSNQMLEHLWTVCFNAFSYISFAHWLRKEWDGKKESPNKKEER